MNKYVLPTILLAAFAAFPSVALAQAACDDGGVLVQAARAAENGDIFRVVGALLALSAAVILVGWIASRFESIPVWVWGVFGMLCAGGLASYGLWAPELFRSYIPEDIAVLIAAAVFAPSLAAFLSIFEGGPAWGFWLLLAASYAGLAIYQDNGIVGGAAVLSLLCAFGFTAGGGGLSYFWGFESEDKIPGTTAVALALAGVFAGLSFAGIEAPHWAKQFETGSFWIGSIVGGTGILIVSSKWYFGEKRHPPYALVQIASLIVLGGALYAGIAIDNDVLRNIALAFIGLFVLEKMVELTPNHPLGWVALAAVAAGACFGIATWYAQNPGGLDALFARIGG